MGVTTSRATARRSRLGRFGLLGTAAVLTATLLSGCGGSATPDGTTDGSAAPTEQARPTPSSVAGPTPVGTVLPGECEDIYTPAMFEGLQEDLPPLNDDSMTDPNFSNTDELEEIFRSLEYLQCNWGRAGETGIVTGVAKVTEEQSTEALAVMESNGFDCYEQNQGTRCVKSESLEGNRLGESHFLRDDVWVSTFWLNAPIRGYTENIVRSIWG